MESAEPKGGLRRWQFGELVLDERTLELSLRGQPLRMHRKPLQVLLHLLQHADEVVTKDELAEACWPGRILSDTVLSTTIKRLRAMLGDDAQQIIKTVHGFGYRFVAPVSVEWLAAEAPARLALEPGDHPPLRPTWSLVERIGGGGSGEVWRVCQDRTGEERVFKFAVDGGALRGLKREVTLYRVLHDSLGEHANLLRVLDWNLERAPFFIETEYQPAGSLLQWSDAQGGLTRVPLTQRLELIAQCAELLAAAHRVGVLHKDLKPSNVLMSGTAPDWQIKLGDFGSGGMLDAQHLQALGITRLGFTQTVAAIDASGTPLYLAPEVQSGQPSTLQSDIYALGVMLYQAVVGDWLRPLAPGWERQIDDELLRDDIAAAVDGDPARRLADAGELARRLRQLDTRHRQNDVRKLAEAEQAHLQRRLERAEMRRRWALALAAVLVLGLASILALYVKLLGTQGEREAALMRARDEADVSQQVNDYVVSLFDAASPEQTGGKPIEPRKLVDLGQAQLKSHFKDRPRLRARMLGTIGNLYCRLGLTGDCERDLGEAITLQRADPDADPLQTARLLYDRSEVEIDDARYDDAARDVRAALDVFERRLPPNDPHTVSALASLGFVLRHEQKIAESVKVLERALALLRDAGGKEGADSMEVLGSLAISEHEAGHDDQALQLSSKTLTLARQSFGTSDIQYLYALDDYGFLMYVAGHYREAEQARRQLLDGYRKLFPPDSYEIDVAENNLAAALRHLGRLHEAGELMRDAVAIERKHGGDSPDFAVTLANYGMLLGETGDYAQALPPLREAYAITRAHYHDSNLLTHRRRFDLAEILIVAGHAAEALPLLQAAVPDALTGVQATRARSLRLKTLADAYLALGQGELAMRNYEQARTMLGAPAVATHDAFAAIDDGRARLALREHRYAEALQYLQPLVGTGAEASPSPALLTEQVELAQTLFGLQRDDEAKSLLVKIGPALEHELAATHPARIEFEQLRGRLNGA